MSCVYKHTFPNGAIYIGRTDVEPEDRWQGGWGYRKNHAMFNAIVKYGWDNIKHEVIEDNLTTQESELLEKHLIEEYSTMVECTYNHEHIPAQQVAQSDLHYISPQKSKRQVRKSKPQLKNKHHIRQTYEQIHKHYEELVPIVHKPEDMHSCPIAVYDTNGNYITTYYSGSIAAEELGVSACDISACARGKKGGKGYRNTVKGYIFRYAPDYNGE